jgi:hypothetical protein
VKVVVVTFDTTKDPLNVVDVNPLIVTVCPEIRLDIPVYPLVLSGVTIVQLTIPDDSVAVIPFEIVGLNPFPITTLFEPVKPLPDHEPTIMLLLPVFERPVYVPRYTLFEPVPPEFPPILTTFVAFDSATEFDVPINTQFDNWYALEPAPDPPINVLYIPLVLLPHRYPMNSEFDVFDVPPPADTPMAVLRYVFVDVASVGMLPELVPRYTFWLLSPTLRRPVVSVPVDTESTFERLKDVEKAPTFESHAYTGRNAYGKYDWTLAVLLIVLHSQLFV